MIRFTSIFLTMMISLLVGTLISRAEITNTTYQTVWDDAGALRVGGQVGDNTAGRFAKGDFSNEEIEAILRHANLITAQMNAEADVDALRTAGQFIPGVGSGVAFAEGDGIRGSSYFVRDVVLTVTGTKLLQSGKTLAGMTLRGTGLGAIQGGTSAGFDIGSDRATAAWNGESYSGTIGGDAWEMFKATRNGAAFGLVLGPVARVASLRAPPVPKTPLSVPAAGEDLFVGLYGQTRRANIQSGLNTTHTPHHVVQNAVSDTSHSLGVTINMRKDLHALTRSYGRNADLGNNVSNLAADVWDMRSIFRGAGYDRSLVNQQMRALIDLNRKVGNVP